jgi:hypothetical protein
MVLFHIETNHEVFESIIIIISWFPHRLLNSMLAQFRQMIEMAVWFHNNFGFFDVIVTCHGKIHAYLFVLS